MKISWCVLCLLLWTGGWHGMSQVAARETVSVDVITPATESRQNTLRLTGSIEALQDTNLAVQQSGAVLELFVDEGDRVNRGDKLLQLDATIAQYRLNELKALLSVAQIEYQEAKRRYEEVLALSKTQVVAETSIAERKADTARANAAQIRQQAAVDLQTEVLKRFTLYAPFEGLIAARNADPGEWVTPQQWVFNLVSNSNLRLRVALPQEYFSSFSNGSIIATVVPDIVSTAPVSANKSADMTLKLPVNNIVAVSDIETRTVTALIDLPIENTSGSGTLISGMSARVILNLGDENENLIWLPRSAIKAHPDGGSSVFAVENGKARRFVVTLGTKRDLGKEHGEEVAVMGADPDLDYVAKGVELLQHGQAVAVNSRTGDN